MKSYKFDIESIKKLTKQMVVLIDTREKRNEHILSYFDKQGITYRKEKLDFGDYTFLLPSAATGQGDIYFHDSIVIERKAGLEELSGNLKKSDKGGYAKELKSEYLPIIFNGEDIGHYWHFYGNERFERPVKKAYRISIHHSFRKNGKVQKKQFVLCTVNYYDLATDFFSLYDWCNSKINLAAEGLSASVDEIYELVQKKIEPLIDKIQGEFHETEEYKTHEKHEKITTIYAAKKARFNEKYGVSGDEYDRIYDVFGTCHNSAYLEKIKADYKARKEYERRSRGQSSSYYEKFYGNYGGYNSGGYCGTAASNYNEADKAMLKKFYRTLSKAFHPDSNPDKDTSEEMKMLNRLKRDWGV